MLRIDIKSPSVGKIAPPYQERAFDRPAHYTWKGRYFDVHGREIIPGQPLPADEHDDPVADEAILPEVELVPPAQLLVRIHDLPMAELRKLAGAHLGDDLHRTRSQIERQLRDLAEHTKETKHPSGARLARARAAREAACDQEWFRGQPQAGGLAETEVEDFHDA